jgi:aspartate/methionine/tyrosine aminotransferase
MLAEKPIAPPAGPDGTPSPSSRGDANDPCLPAFRRVPRTGVIYVTEEAKARGFSPRDPSWCNLGQGQPETGSLPGSPPRIASVELADDDHEYSPVAGLDELRAAVAEHYNRLFRRGLPSKYGPENVAIAGGGRIALTRAVAALGPINLGHFLPDYTAYEELLEIFRPFLPIPILLDPENGYAFTARDLEREVLGRGLSAVLLSNPCNPTGRLVWGENLAEWVDSARRTDCTLLLDEFYSHYVWADGADTPASAARYVEDVDRDPVLLFDGLTKNFRYPGWRLSWTLGPRSVIRAIASAGSFLDGGPSRPLQRAAIELLEPGRVAAEIRALQRAFAPKRELVLDRCRRLGLTVELPPEGTFYAFVSVRDLPGPLADGVSFFRHALDHRVICVPGIFFDVNPGQRRALRLARFHQHVRLSFGPPIEVVARGLDRLAAMIDEHR